MKYLFRKIFLVTALMAMSAAAVAQEVPSIFSYTVLKLPFDHRNEEPWSKIIHSQEEWELFYSELLDDNLAESNAVNFITPQIDFETFQLITGGIGFRPSGAYSVSVGKVIELSDVIHIEVFVISPGKNCVVTADVAYPSTTILIRKTDKPIQFSSSQLIFECPL